MKPRLLFFEEVSKIQYTTITSCADSSLKDARYLIRHFYNLIFLHILYEYHSDLPMKQDIMHKNAHQT